LFFQSVTLFLFFNPQTRSYIKDIKRSFKTACRKVGIKELRFHDLRHTAATKMIESGIDLVTVSKILGHASIQMTMRYVHPTPENMKMAVDTLGEIFEKSRQKEVEQNSSIDPGKLASSSFLYN